MSLVAVEAEYLRTNRSRNNGVNAVKRIKMLDLARYSTDIQARVLGDFLYFLTMGFRDIYSGPSKNILHQLRGINQINHMIMPFIHSLLYGEKTTYTTDVIMQNLVDMASNYEIEEQVNVAWYDACSSNRIDWQ